MSHLRQSNYGSQAPRGNLSLVFYAERYHPVQAGSIDGTDTAPHDRGIKRALQAFRSGIYDPFSDSKTIGDPLKTLFVGRLSPITTENDLRQVLEQYGAVRTLRLVRDVVSGASKRYAFVEFEDERGFEGAYKRANGSLLHDSPLLVDWNRQRLMTGWIPRRRPVPTAELEQMGILPPPTRNFLRPFDVPPLPPAFRENRETKREGGMGYGRQSKRESFGQRSRDLQWGDKREGERHGGKDEGGGGDRATRMGKREGEKEGEGGLNEWDKGEKRGERGGKRNREEEREKRISKHEDDDERDRDRGRDRFGNINKEGDGERGRDRSGDMKREKSGDGNRESHRERNSDGDKERGTKKVRERSESGVRKRRREETKSGGGGGREKDRKKTLSEDGAHIVGDDDRWSSGR